MLQSRDHRRRRPTLKAVFTDQSAAAGSLYEFNTAMVSDEPIGGDSAATSRVQPFSFACELATGSNEMRVSGFGDIQQLYDRISECFGIPKNHIMFCTLDTPQIDMTKILGNQLSFNHVIYVHTRGQTKEVRFVKSEEALGITVTDNKSGGVFVKRVSSTGIIATVNIKQMGSILPGDLFECINGKSFIGSKHVEVVEYLKGLPLGGEIVLRLISPEKTLLPGISKRQKRTASAFGNQTIRITTVGVTVTAAINKEQTRVLKKLAEAVDDFLGIADEELAQSIFDIQCRSSTKEEFSEKLESNLKQFNFPDYVADKFWTSYENYLYAQRVDGNTEPGFEILLDKQRLRTPVGNNFRVPHEGLALAAAHEWDSQKEIIQRYSMPLTTMCNMVLDNPTELSKETIIQGIMEFADTDTICFRVDTPEDLLEQQEAEWGAVLDFIEQQYKFRPPVTSGFSLPTIPAEFRNFISRHLLAYNRWGLVGFQTCVVNLKSLWLTLAMVDGKISSERAVALSRLEQTFQEKRWGNVPWFHDVEAVELNSRVAAGLLVIIASHSRRSVKKMTTLP